MNKQNINSDFEKVLNREETADQLAEFLGWHIGDGCISVNKRYSEYALTGDLIEEHPFYNEVIMPAFNKLFRKFLNKEIKLKEYSSSGVCGIYLFDRNFVEILQKNLKLTSGKKIKVRIPEIIKTHNQKINFLRALFDTDGSIYFCRSNVKTKNESLFTVFHYKPKIKLATISKDLIEGVYGLLCELGFSPRMRKPAKQRRNENTMFGVVLHRKRDTQRWIKEVGFRNAKHVTKVQLAKKFGFCPPHTTLKERKAMLSGKLNPAAFYPRYSHLSLNYVKENLSRHWGQNI